MIRPYFRHFVRQDQLWAAAKAWEGTPFAANAASRGHGVGCVNYVAELCFEVGALPRLAIPTYALDHGKHSGQSQLLSYLLSEPLLQGRLMFVPHEAQRMPGDIAACLSGHVDHHLSIALQWSKVTHAVEDFGVVIHGLDEMKFSRRVVYWLRIMEEVE